MTSSLHQNRVVLFLTILMTQVAGCAEQSEITQEYPQRPVKLIVPFGAGGGSDTFARILAKAIDEHQLLPQPLVIINVPGAGGTLGSRRLKNSRPDGYTIMQLHEGMVTSKYSGHVNYGPEAFEMIAGMGISPMVIGVGETSRFQSLNDLMEAATANKDEVIFAANIGAPSQFAGLMLEKASPGARFRFSQTGDGAKRFAGLQGGHTDVSAFSLAEYIQFKPSGLQAIALLDVRRHPDAGDIPTAIEQGYDVVSTNMQFWWAPKGTPPSRLNTLTTALQQAMQTEEVQTRLTQLKIAPIALEGEQLSRELKNRMDSAAAVAQRPTVPLPNFPLWIGGAVIVLAVLSFVPQRFRSTFASPAESTASEFSYQKMFFPTARVCFVLVLTSIYIASMQSGLLGYQLATFLFLLFQGIVLTVRNRRLLTTMVILSIFMSLGLHYVFTQVFVIDLP